MWGKYVGREGLGEFAELGEVVPNLEVGAVQEDGEDCLGCAGVLDHLVCEEEGRGGGVVEGAVYGLCGV
jgi:hypothetical protein